MGIDLIGTPDPIDPAATVAGLRTIGTGAQQAAAGNHTHTSTTVTIMRDTNATSPIGGIPLDSVLQGFPITVNHYYAVNLRGAILSSSSNYLFGCVGAPTGSVNISSVGSYYGLVVSATSGHTYTGTPTLNNASQLTYGASGNVETFTLEHTVLCTGTGSLGFYWSNSNLTAATTLYAGAWMSVTDLGT